MNQYYRSGSGCGSGSCYRNTCITSGPEGTNCNREIFYISGKVIGVNGSPARRVTVNYSVDGEDGFVTTNRHGDYSISVPRCAAVSVSVDVGLGVTVSPGMYYFGGVCADSKNRNFRLHPVVPPAPVTYTVSGNVSGLASDEGVQVFYSIDGVLAIATTDVDGNYAFTADAGTTVVITPMAQTGYSVAPASYTITGLAGDTPDQDFVYTPLV